MKLYICQNFNAGEDYKAGDIVEADGLNGRTWVERGLAIPAEDAPAPEKKSRVTRKRKAAQATDDS